MNRVQSYLWWAMINQQLWSIGTRSQSLSVLFNFSNEKYLLTKFESVSFSWFPWLNDRVTYVKNASGCWPTVVSDVMKVVQSPIQYPFWILFSIWFDIVFLIIIIGLVIHIKSKASRTEDNNHSEYTSLLGGEQIHLRKCFNCCSTRSDWSHFHCFILHVWLIQSVRK